MRHGSLFLISLSRRPEAKQVQEAAAKVLMGSELKTVRCQWAGGVTAGVRESPPNKERRGKRRKEEESKSHCQALESARQAVLYRNSINKNV